MGMHAGIVLQAAEIAAPTSTGAASTVGSSIFVRVVNSGTTAYLVTIVDAPSGNVIGSTTVAGQESMILNKAKTDCIFAANAAIKLSSVGTRG